MKTITKRKVIFTITGLFLVTGLFSLTGEALAERVDLSWLPSSLQTFMGQIIALNPAGEGEVLRYYDLLIKKTDNGDDPASYRSGDIVAARPHGHEWSHSERQNFWIVKMYITETQMKELTSPKRERVVRDESDRELSDPDEVQFETVMRRKYRIPPQALEQLKEGKLIRQNYAKEKSN